MTVEQIGFLYEYFYRKIFDPAFRYTPATKIEGSITKFIAMFHKQYPTGSWNTMYGYFVFQFQLWESKGINNYNKSVNYNNIIGAQPFKRYKDRNQEFDWISRDSAIIKKYKLSLSDFKRRYSIDVKVVREEGEISTTTTTMREISGIEAALRAQGLNTEGGFLDCIELTTLHDPEDKSCKVCIFATDCKDIQRKNLPRIYNNRNK